MLTKVFYSLRVRATMIYARSRIFSMLYIKAERSGDSAGPCQRDDGTSDYEMQLLCYAGPTFHHPSVLT